MMTHIRIDPEIAALLTPLTPEEQALLERSLLNEGCRDPLTLWSQGNVLLDGHHRHSLCTAHGIPFDVRFINLPDRRAAIEWRLAEQLGRRNLSPMQASYFRGRLFQSARRPGSRTDLTSGQNVARSLATRYGIDRRTLTRDAAFARALDSLTANLGGEFRTMVLTRQARLTRREVMELGRMPAARQEDYLRVREEKPAVKQVTTKTSSVLAAGRQPDGACSVPPPDLHAAWERAAQDERLLFLGRPDVLAAAAELLRHGRREEVA
jgi:hypothetical protein